MDINIAQILFQIVNFSVVVGALTILLYKPILKIFEERARRIEEGQKAATAAIKGNEQIDEMRKEVKKEIAKEKAKELKEAHVQAEEMKAQILAEAKEEAQKQIAKLKTEWLAEQQDMLKKSQTAIVEAVIQTSEKVLGESLKTDKKQKDLIESELKNVLKAL